MRAIKTISFTVLGYALGAIATYFAIYYLSNNTHDKAIESSMTAIFVGGPLSAVIALIMSLNLIKRK